MSGGNLMKKRLYFLLVVLLMGSITACGGAADTSKHDSVQTKESEETQVMDSARTEDFSETQVMDLTRTGNSSEMQTEITKNYKEGVLDASELFVKDGRAFWGYGGQLCSALLDDTHDMYDFAAEKSLDGEISSIALDGDEMYLATENGIVCLPYGESGQEQGGLSVIDEHALSTSSFQIYDGNIYFRYGKKLYQVPKQGGETRTMEENVEAFQVTVEGVYCLNSNGDFIRVSLDGTERKTLCELNSDGEIVIRKDKAYITTGDDKDYIYVYGLEEDTLEKLHFEKDLSPYYPVWVTEKYIYYESDDFKVYQYDIESGTESQSAVLYDLPDYECGYLENDVLYYVYSNNLFWMHMDSGESVKLAKGEVINTSSNTGSDTVAAGSSGGWAEDEYNIAEDIGVYNSEGMARLESKHFTLYLPADGNWTYRVNDNSSVSIYYEPAYESGAGGHLVTIEAYDWNDNTYADFPASTIAGPSDDKKYVAIFPTDVQFEPGQEAGYRRMYEYVQRIDNSEEKAINNPFSCQ